MNKDLFKNYCPVKAENLYGPFKINLPMPGRTEITETSILNKISYVKSYNMSFISAKAIINLLMPIFNDEIKNFSFYGKTKEGQIYFEYWDEPQDNFDEAKDDYGDSRKLIGLVTRTGVLKMAEVKDGEFKSVMLNCDQTKSMKGNKHSGSAWIFSELVKLMLKSNGSLSGLNEYEQIMMMHIQGMIDSYRNSNEQEMLEYFVALDNDIYALMGKNSEKITGKNPMNPNILEVQPKLLEIDDIPDEFEVKYGSSNIKTASKPKAAKSVVFKSTTIKEIGDEYKLNKTRVLTEEEQKLVPSMDEFIPNFEIKQKAKLICESSKMERPFRNLLWTGETGSGKSTACAMLAQLLGLPYVFVTINPDTMLQDLYVNFLPNTSKNRLKEMPSFEDIMVNPEGVYKTLTGEDKPGATGNDCLKALSEHSDDNNDFICVKSELVKAVENGWLVEIQEANLASKPGVLGGINALMDDLGTILLPTGEVIKRHPDTVIVMTANVGYEGTKRLNQAVKSRLSLKGTFELPQDKELVENIKLRSGNSNKDQINKIIESAKAIRKVLEENGAEDGSCGLRDLINWAQAALIMDDLMLSAEATVIPSSSDDDDVKAAVRQAIQLRV